MVLESGELITNFHFLRTRGLESKAREKWGMYI